RPPAASPLLPYTTLFRSFGADQLLRLLQVPALSVDEHGHHHGEDPASGQAAERQQRAAGELRLRRQQGGGQHGTGQGQQQGGEQDRKSTRLNSSHVKISY